MWILYILFGVVGGIFCGLGMGGGSLLIPLISLLGLPQKSCQTINLISFIITASFSLIVHYKNGLLVTKNLFRTIFAACSFSFITSLISCFLNGVVLKKCLGAFLLVVAIIQLWKIIYEKFKKNHLKNLRKIK